MKKTEIKAHNRIVDGEKIKVKSYKREARNQHTKRE